MKNRAKLRLVHPVSTSRPFKTDYAGAFSGHCKTREGAIMAAMKHIVKDGYSRATITDTETDTDVARVSLNKERTRAVVEVIKPLRKVGL